MMIGSLTLSLISIVALLCCILADLIHAAPFLDNGTAPPTDLPQAVDTIKITPATADAIAQVEITLANDWQRIEIKPSEDKIHLLFPRWWINTHQAQVSCVTFINADDEENATVNWTPMDPDFPDEGPILTITPTKSIAVLPFASLSILCHGLMTPAVVPTEATILNQRKLAEQPIGNESVRDHNHRKMSWEFGLMILNDNEQIPTVDKILTMTSPHLSSSPIDGPFFMTISTPDGNPFPKVDPKTGQLNQVYSRAICAYVKKVTHSKVCILQNDEPHLKSSTWMIIHRFDGPYANRGAIMNDKSHLTAFRHFVKDLFQLKELPVIDTHIGF